MTVMKFFIAIVKEKRGYGFKDTRGDWTTRI